MSTWCTAELDGTSTHTSCTPGCNSSYRVRLLIHMMGAGVGVDVGRMPCEVTRTVPDDACSPAVVYRRASIVCVPEMTPHRTDHGGDVSEAIRLPSTYISTPATVAPPPSAD